MSEISVKLTDVVKYYKLYRNPKDRMRESLSLSGKSFHTKHYALHGISLELKPGDVLGVVGRNGSGKSTLLKIISGILQPNEGSVEVKGNISALLELGGGFNPEFSGYDNIIFYGTLMGYSRDYLESIKEEIIAFADLGEYIYQPVKTYSSGMRSRLAFAIATAVEPEILIVDEVLAVGDLSFKKKCFDKMRGIFESGKIVIYVSHSLDSVVRFCNKAVLLHKGKIAYAGEPREAVKIYEMSQVNPEFSMEKYLEERSAKAGADRQEPETDFALPAGVSIESEEFTTPGCAMSGYFLQNADGTEVGSLTFGSWYTFGYDIEFYEDYENVTFSFHIHDIQGMRITGSAYHMLADQQFINVRAGDVVKARFDFQCLMNTGAYYINAGVGDVSGAGSVSLGKSFNVKTFKVGGTNSLFSGVSFQNQKVRYEIM